MCSALADALADVMPDYEIPTDDLVGEVLIPAMTHAEEVRIGAGFFSSQCLAQVAPGLGSYIARDGVVRLLASTSLSPEDRDAIERGLLDPQEATRGFQLALLEERD